MKSGFVAIAGRPNSGKSTLMNRLLGSAVSIVTPKAQTTRERVLGILTEEQGQLIFIDTPGVHKAKAGGINEFMVAEAREALEGAAVVWYLIDPWSAIEHELVVLDLLKQGRIPVLILLNKADLRMPQLARDHAAALAREAEEAAGRRGIEVLWNGRISAIDGTGLEELLRRTWAALPEGPLYFPDPDQLSDRPTRFFVGEKIREQLLLQLGEELPYSCAVEIESYDEAAKPPRIEATIHVERDSQKGMVIGKGGQKIKAIGQAARRTIEEFVGGQVFLGLKVKVLKDWTRDREALRRMGYHLPAAGWKR